MDEETANYNDRKMRDVLLGPQNNVATATTSRNLGRDQRRIDFKNLVSNYEKKVSIQQYMTTIVDYYNNQKLEETLCKII